MQLHRVRESCVVRRVWYAGVLAVALGGTALLADAQVPAATQGNGAELSALNASLSSSTPRPMIVAGAGKTTMIVGGAITSSDFEGADDRFTSIVALVPRVAIGRNISDRFALEVPISIQSFKGEGEDRFNRIDIGVRPAVAVFGNDGTRGVITLLGRLNRQSDGDESTTRFGYELGAGPEFRINDAISFRTTLVYGSLAEDEDVGLVKQTYVGLNLDLVHNLSAVGPVQSGGFTLRSGATFTSVSPDDEDGFSSIDIPSPYLGLFFGVGESGKLRIGSEVVIVRGSAGDESASDFTFLPTVEYDLGAADQLGLRLRGLAFLSHQSFDVGLFDESGTTTGFGAGAAVVFPLFQRYRGAFGLDYLMLQENEDLGVPSTNVIRGTFGIELPF